MFERSGTKTADEYFLPCTVDPERKHIFTATMTQPSKEKEQVVRKN